MKTQDEMPFDQMCELLGYVPRGRKLTTAEAAEVLGVKKNTLEVKRTYGIGPKYIKPPGSKCVHYLERDVLEYMLSGRRKSTSETVHAPA